MTLDITERPSVAEFEAISNGLNSARKESIPPFEKRDLTVIKRHAGIIQGGLIGSTNWGWLYIKLLWVEEDHRHLGIGRNLVIAAENEAVRRGCASAYVITHTFQAVDFYRKLGYEVFGRLEDFPPGYGRIFLRKMDLAE